MNKHVSKLSKEASDARKMIDESESGDSEESEGDDNDKAAGNGSAKKSNAPAATVTVSGEKPTEEQVEKLEEKLEAAQGDQKNLFLIIFQVSSKISTQTFFEMVGFKQRWIDFNICHENTLFCEQLSMSSYELHFQRFIMILSEHLVRCDTDGIDFKNPWYHWTVGRLQQVFLMVRNL